MAYNRIGTPKFYIDAVLLARKLGYIDDSANNLGAYYLNPTKTKTIPFYSEHDAPNNDTFYINKGFLQTNFKSRYFFNSISHLFILGHKMDADNVYPHLSHLSTLGESVPSSNGWTKYEFPQKTELDFNESYDGAALITFNRIDEALESTIIGDVSLGWSYTMRSPDMELTQTFGNESLKTVNTKGGHTLSSVGWNQPPMWGNYPQWSRFITNIAYPTRRSWNLKFSYLADENSDNSGLMPQYYNELDIVNRGIFERINASDSFSIKNDFLSKVYSGTNGFQLPFIFQPNTEDEEYAIARVNADSVTMNQVANNIYDISISIIETF